MQSWPRPEIPVVPGESTPPCLYDTATASLVEAKTGGSARLYVCGITPYDATHIGHAATYVAYDTLQRVWRDAGLTVHYAQNVTDIDDPLLDRARETNVSWRDLADEQVDLFRADMESLGVIPPDDFVAVTEVIAPIGEAVERMLKDGTAYRVPTPESDAGDDVYFDIAATESRGVWTLGSESGYDRETMLALSAERGGDPDRPGKRDPIDPLLWRAARAGEPHWPSPLGDGRPGWHIECSVIALRELGTDFTVQGGGSDLIFPHHELSAAHAAALSGEPLARVFSHTGMVAYQGEKMSKSLGNLVLVSALRSQGIDPRYIRLAILDHHYRSDWEWTDGLLSEAEQRVAAWSRAFSSSAPSGADATSVLRDVRVALRRDLDTPAALAVLDDAARTGVDDAAALRAAVLALMGVALA
ncbi:cysteine--1-D-myo-inosityl 2-amino-2-deoxy-alpha-D-glucopyranoside ligase [Paramicrobacterium agarici]|uniref:cysteine--1-D-myo-inosityl 2-amino-2-deoxy-alpha-D-glucopyranoside ligase n=1 Tax=Paramicrobacterium agarici TaxID=630514 RepID=UPI001153D201|nr:cysteine--1-D-myo-inosityl 2-amino-2-deoxy-alpha-D-glucopyranoside ligase [Microbacterium agarici]TQO21290.1 L-cysteine:1D-myo-inositol 2-amino-2-deoxy-alpha-D-glucopyranoside ligase [Microbacterium agarici]